MDDGWMGWGGCEVTSSLHLGGLGMWIGGEMWFFLLFGGKIVITTTMLGIFILLMCLVSR
jgi:hypothetical protein